VILPPSRYQHRKQVSEVRTRLGASGEASANSGLIPVYAGPKTFGIKRQLHSFRTGSLGQVAQFQIFPREKIEPVLLAPRSKATFAFPFRCPAGMSKKAKPLITFEFKDAQRRADKQAGTPDGEHLKLPLRLAKP
jgi:hypothetical protein